MIKARLTNLDYLNDITGGESAVTKEFIQLFFDQLPEFRDGMTLFLDQKKWKELGELAHKAKSSVMTFGLNDLGHQLKKLQLKTQNLSDIETYSADVAYFMKTIALAEAELKEEFSRL